jgi:hypothetical protein
VHRKFKENKLKVCPGKGGGGVYGSIQIHQNFQSFSSAGMPSGWSIGVTASIFISATRALLPDTAKTIMLLEENSPNKEFPDGPEPEGRGDDKTA